MSLSNKDAKNKVKLEFDYKQSISTVLKDSKGDPSKKKLSINVILKVKNDKGNVVVVRFGDPNLSIKRDDPARRKSFRARHNCDDPGPKYKPRYWSCFQWRAGAEVDN